MPTGVRYIDHSGQAIVELSLAMATLAESAAEIIVEEIEREIDDSSPSGAFYYVKRGAHEKRSDERAARREFDVAVATAKAAGKKAPKKRRRILKTRKYQASAVGQPPARPTMRYARSWHATAAGRKGNSIAALAFSKAKFSDGTSMAAGLEYGKGRIKPRPHMEAGLERARIRIAQLTNGRRVAA